MVINLDGIEFWTSLIEIFGFKNFIRFIEETRDRKI